ncbi:acyl-CoA thioester hydrolase [Rhizobium sp. NFR07]|uniref:acyl-CoA thioesterase n=1 Tax=Rhizobium sp. NFR07 TaxID=1566262 RepID=UPI0008EB6BDC|nr:thioesterase family protein [Rhizobium sp. NFR07]SFB06660.1 acyl-CoA thioester hydrolase [Rhizobium sp. NFR07]
MVKDTIKVSEFRVAFRDVDRNGQMFRSVYIDRAEEAVADFWRRRKSQDSDPRFTIGKVAGTFHIPLQMGDAVHMHVGVSKIGGKSAGFLVRMTRGADSVAEVEIVWVAVDAETGASISLPEDLRDWLYKFLD